LFTQMQTSRRFDTDVDWRCFAVLAALIALAVAPSVAVAASQRFASPAGSGAACTQASPCDIVEAINNAAAGDEVILTGQDYGSAAGPVATGLISAQPNLDLHGADGQPRPRIFTSAVVGLDLRGIGSTARHFEIDQTSGVGDPQAVILRDLHTSDLVVRNVGDTGGKACTLLGDALLTNSVCEATGPDGYGIFPYRTGASINANNSVIRNVTVVASGASGTGILAVGGPTVGDAQNLAVTNTIVVVPSGNTAIAASGGTGAASITIDHSNFGLQSASGGGQIINGAGNQQLSGSPLFVAPGDYHQALGSMTIDAGATSPFNGARDFDGDPRSLGFGGTDIGADEFVPAPIALTGDPGSIKTTSAVVKGTVNPDTVATTYHFDVGTTTAYEVSTAEKSAGSDTTTRSVSELLSSLAPGTVYHYRVVATSAGGTTLGADRTFTTATPTTTTTTTAGGGTTATGPTFLGEIVLTPNIFAAATRGRSASMARRKAHVGTMIGFGLDEAATVRFTVQRKLPGRRAGSRCVKPGKRNRTARKCTRYVLQRGSFTMQTQAGQTRVRFTGRLRSRKLAVGSYRLLAVAKDAAGRASVVKRASFKIVRR
jgi:hypothetical protein